MTVGDCLGHGSTYIVPLVAMSNVPRLPVFRMPTGATVATCLLLVACGPSFSGTEAAPEVSGGTTPIAGQSGSAGVASGSGGQVQHSASGGTSGGTITVAVAPTGTVTPVPVPAPGVAGGAGGAEGETQGTGGEGIDPYAVTQTACGEGVPAKWQWSARASHHDWNTQCGWEQDASSAIDDNSQSRFTTGKFQTGDEWLEIDFGAVATFNHVVLDALGTDCSDGDDYARHYALQISDAPLDFDAPVVAEGYGSFDETAVAFEAPVSGRYLLIRQKGWSAEHWWSVTELYVTCE
jgi:hypothetical protein